MPSMFDRLANMFGLGHAVHSLTAQGMILDVLNEHSARINKYAQNWRTYLGEDIRNLAKNKEDGTDDQPEVNFLRRNIDKINWWSFGKPFQIICPGYQEIMNLAHKCWGSKKIEKLTQIAQFGSVCGDAMVLVAPSQVAEVIKSGEVLPSLTIADIKVVPLNPSFCTPVYDPFDIQELIAMQIDIPMRSIGTTGNKVQFQHMTITKDAVVTYIKSSDGKIEEGSTKEYKNPIGAVYCVHIRNGPLGDALYGTDDIRDASRLNRTYNEKMLSTGEIIDYHGSPITLVYGTKASNLTRGPNKIWGNLPKDGKVETLELKSDLAANNEYIKNVRADLHTVMGVPEIAQGTAQAISNTSGVALHTMYMPMLERVWFKWSVYGPHFLEISILCLRWLQHLDLLKEKDDRGRLRQILKKQLTEEDFLDIRCTSTVTFEAPLPKDRIAEASVQHTRVKTGTQSIRGAMIAQNVPDPDALMKEIEKEKSEGLHDIFSTRNNRGEDHSGLPSSGMEEDNGVHKKDPTKPLGRPSSGSTRKEK